MKPTIDSGDRRLHFPVCGEEREKGGGLWEEAKGRDCSSARTVPFLIPLLLSVNRSDGASDPRRKDYGGID
jgi:hypothetical protein